VVADLADHRPHQLSGEGARLAQEALTRADALRCATRTAPGSHSTRQEGLARGRQAADLAVLSADPLTVEIKHRYTTSLMTMVGGRVVHETKDWLN
jgi:predicted amidohydrolase YtcJ